MPNRIVYSILSPAGDFICRQMLAPVCREDPSTLRIHQFELVELVSGWGVYARKSARTCPFDESKNSLDF